MPISVEQLLAALPTEPRFPILERRLTQHAGTLSGGEKKILSFARGLAEDRPIAERIADRYPVMDQGRAMLEGTPATIDRNRILAHPRV